MLRHEWLVGQVSLRFSTSLCSETNARPFELVEKESDIDKLGVSDDSVDERPGARRLSSEDPIAPVMSPMPQYGFLQFVQMRLSHLLPRAYGATAVPVKSSQRKPVRPVRCLPPARLFRRIQSK